MGNRELKKKLGELYPTPDRERKRDFLRHMGRQEISQREMIRRQIRYVSPLVWVLSAQIFALCFAAAHGFTKNAAAICCASGLMPFLAMAAAAELRRSKRFNMEELEKATRFSLSSVLMARLLILGIGNAALLLALMPVMCLEAGLSAAEALLWTVCPYCLSAWLNLAALRKHRQMGYGALSAISAGVSIGFVMLSEEPAAWSGLADGLLVPACAVLLCAMTVRECRIYLMKSEGFQCC